MGDIARRQVCSFNRRIIMNGLAGNAAHDVNAKFQAKSMNVFAKRFKALSAFGRRETVYCRDQTGVVIHLQTNEWPVGI
ncbi:hypothetical protein D3C71_2020260 [compost metagenome]